MSGLGCENVIESGDSIYMFYKKNIRSLLNHVCVHVSFTEEPDFQTKYFHLVSTIKYMFVSVFK